MNDRAYDAKAFQILNGLAYNIAEYFKKRGTVIHPFERTGHHPSELLGMAGMEKVGLMKSWHSGLFSCTPDELETKFIMPWSFEFFSLFTNSEPLQFFELELPKHQVAATYIERGGVFIRTVVGYSIDADEMIIRFDSLVRYDQ